jgi:6-phosphofructokinase 1
MDLRSIPTQIQILGEARINSPIRRKNQTPDEKRFVSDTSRILIDVNLEILQKMIEEKVMIPSFEMAGPRSQIYFDPSKVKCALVTCGGLCPGLNDIIRAIVLELYYGYGTKNVIGIRYGLQGFIPSYGHELLELTPQCVGHILEMGGTILGSSRGPQSIEEIVDSLMRLNIGILFMIGGDGTLKAASQLADVILERNLKISVVGIPKTIDNDIYLVSRSFGFDTAVEVATQALVGAHNEAAGYHNGIGLIKLMGRHSGFIAATAALAQQEVNFVLIPEVDIDLEGPNGFLTSLEKRLQQREHAVVLVAEGAGQRFFDDDTKETDESGNVRLKDIGIYLKDAITSYFEKRKIPINLKYIDPSYIIRSLPANANDHAFCSFLGRDAVHAAMAGKTKMLVGNINGHFVHVPLEATAGKRKQVDPQGKLWLNVLDATGQGSLINN